MGEFAVKIMLSGIAAGLIEFLLPDGELRKCGKFVISIYMLSLVVFPIASLLGAGNEPGNIFGNIAGNIFSDIPEGSASVLQDKIEDATGYGEKLYMTFEEESATDAIESTIREFLKTKDLEYDDVIRDVSIDTDNEATGSIRISLADDVISISDELRSFLADRFKTDISRVIIE